jgi:hypothetical protein
MHAMLDYNSNIVVAVFPPDMSNDEMIASANGRTLIKMTSDRSQPS